LVVVVEVVWQGGGEGNDRTLLVPSDYFDSVKIFKKTDCHENLESRNIPLGTSQAKGRMCVIMMIQEFCRLIPSP
jgi:hypothetical protein